MNFTPIEGELFSQESTNKDGQPRILLKDYDFEGVV